MCRGVCSTHLALRRLSTRARVLSPSLPLCSLGVNRGSSTCDVDGASAAAAQLCAEASCAREGTSMATVCAGVPHSAVCRTEQRALELGARGPRAQAAVYTAAHRRVRDRRAEAARGGRAFFSSEPALRASTERAAGEKPTDMAKDKKTSRTSGLR